MNNFNKGLTLNINNIAEGIFAVDKKMTIHSFNVAAHKITGWQAQEVIGHKCFEIFQSPNCGEACPLRETLENNTASYKKVLVKNKDGRLIPLTVSTMALEDKENNILGGLVIFYNQTRVNPSSFGKFNELGLIGSSSVMKDVFQLVETVANTDCHVIITGPTGTGKNVVARVIHKLSRRKNNPFVEVNCAALSDTLVESELFGHERGAFTGAVTRRIGRFEVADGGTIFLDEIGEICANFQAKLLRVVEQGEFERVGSSKTIKVNVRLIAATNKDLNRLVKEGCFREDLYYRLNVFAIDLPPLASRKSDIKPLVEYFISEFNKIYKNPKVGISDEAMTLLYKYNYPGNIRELRNIIEHAFIKSATHIINKEDLPFYLLEAANGIDRLTVTQHKVEEERYYIEEVIKQCNGNKAQAAKLLGISRKTLYNKLHKYNLM